MSHPQFQALLDELAALHHSKDHDYSPDAPLSNFRRSEKLGVDPFRGVLVRMSDKWSRIEHLSSGRIPKHESLRDSLIDLAGYALISVIFLDESDK